MLKTQSLVLRNKEPVDMLAGSFGCLVRVVPNAETTLSTWHVWVRRLDKEEEWREQGGARWFLYRHQCVHVLEVTLGNLLLFSNSGGIILYFRIAPK